MRNSKLDALQHFRRRRAQRSPGSSYDAQGGLRAHANRTQADSSDQAHVDRSARPGHELQSCEAPRTDLENVIGTRGQHEAPVGRALPVDTHRALVDLAVGLRGGGCKAALLEGIRKLKPSRIDPEDPGSKVG